MRRKSGGEAKSKLYQNYSLLKKEITELLENHSI